FNKLIKIIYDHEDLFNLNKDTKILTTNCFTRKDRLYHPSDMFLCGMQPILSQYYSLELRTKTHNGTIMEMIQEMKSSKSFEEVLRSPEIELCRSYLKLKNWNFKNNREDSLDAIKKYFIVVNSWDIDLRWNKKRTPLKPRGALIYPQYFDAIPFEGAPVEHTSCYNRHDIEGKLKIKDIFYILQSKFLWRFWEGNRKYINIKWFVKHCIRMIVIIIVNIVPFFIGKRFARIAYAPSLKNEIKALLKKTFVFNIYNKLKINQVNIFENK
uniref:hypothetical protein n=1 Tax=uncultured Clostridium sp. TaxID=59620 RepID=UPI0025F860B7